MKKGRGNHATANDLKTLANATTTDKKVLSSVPLPPAENVKIIKCTVCNIICQTDVILQDHLKGKRHKKTMAAIGSSSSRGNASVTTVFCNVCKIHANSAGQYDVHVKSPKHISKIEKMETDAMAESKTVSIECAVCKKMFPTCAKFKHHISTREHITTVELMEQKKKKIKPITSQSSSGNSYTSTGSNPFAKKPFGAKKRTNNFYTPRSTSTTYSTNSYYDQTGSTTASHNMSTGNLTQYQYGYAQASYYPQTQTSYGLTSSSIKESEEELKSNISRLLLKLNNNVDSCSPEIRNLLCQLGGTTTNSKQTNNQQMDYASSTTSSQYRINPPLPPSGWSTAEAATDYSSYMTRSAPYNSSTSYTHRASAYADPSYGDSSARYAHYK